MKRYHIRSGGRPKVKRNKAGLPRERFEGLRLEDYRQWIRNRPCLLHSENRCVYAEHQSDAAHVEAKARGTGDQANLVSLCRRHHREQHDYGPRSFDREHAETLGNQPLRVIAGALWLEYEQAKGINL